MDFLNTILNIVFPAKCISCGSLGPDLCLKCLRELPEAERETEKWIFPMYDYRHPLCKRALWLLKYKGKRTLANVFAEVMYGRMLEELSELSVMENFRDAVLIPIPLSKKRYRERGFNQAELICNGLVKLDDNINFKLEKNILFKPRETTHQALIENRAERLTNIVGSFAVKDGASLNGKNVILIDDVATTGATLSEAKKILKKFGAGKIIAFTVAH